MVITFDWDDISEEVMSQRLGILQRSLLYSRLLVYKSCSGRGYHIKVFGSGADREQMLYLRKVFWDDPVRLKIDAERSASGVCANVLFSRKGKYPDKESVLVYEG